MIRKDFILRLVEEIAKAIGKILHLIKDGDFEEAQRLYDYNMSLLKGVEEEELLNSDVAEFYNQLANENGSVDNVLQKLAHLLYAGAKINERQGNNYLYALKLNKSIEILEYLDANSTTFSFERNALLADIKASRSE